MSLAEDGQKRIDSAVSGVVGVLMEASKDDSLKDKRSRGNQILTETATHVMTRQISKLTVDVATGEFDKTSGSRTRLA